MTEHKAIFLQPVCDSGHCDHEGAVDSGGDRLWCQDDVWGECKQCGKTASRYLLQEGRE